MKKFKLLAEEAESLPRLVSNLLALSGTRCSSLQNTRRNIHRSNVEV
jgi:hypothetical protein